MQRSFGSFEKNGCPTLKIGTFFWTFEGELKVVVNFLFKKICQHYLVEINQMLSFKKNSAICLCGFHGSWHLDKSDPDPEKVQLRKKVRIRKRSGLEAGAMQYAIECCQLIPGLVEATFTITVVHQIILFL